MSLKTSSAALQGGVSVPGSVANLGGGFDTLGVAVQLYLRATIVDILDDGGARLVVTRSSPPVNGVNGLERAYAALVRLTGRRVPTVSVEVKSDVPMAAGLGSSAAATVAGLRIFERVAGRVERATLLAIATEIEGHADNAAPALFGGLNSVLETPGGEPRALRWPWPNDLLLVVATPAAGLATAKARAVLPDMLPRADAIFNLQRVLSLVHALQQGDYAGLREAVKDRWHQTARASLVPLLNDILAVDHEDVLGAFLSGAGPSVAVLARVEGAPGVERLLASMYARAGVDATVRVLAVHDTASDAPPQAVASPADPRAAAGERSNRAADGVMSARGRAV